MVSDRLWLGFGNEGELGRVGWDRFPRGGRAELKSLF